MRALLERIRPFLRTAYVLCVLVAMAWALSGLDLAPAQALGLLVLPWSVVFMCAWVLMVLSLGLLWRTWLWQAEGVSLHLSEWLPAQAMGWAGRYLPGKVGLFMGKLAVVRQRRVGMRALLLSVLVEQLGFVVAGACVALALFSSGMLGAWSWFPARIADAWNMWMPAAVLAAVLLMGAAVAVSARILGCGGIGARSLRAMGLLVLHAGPHLLVGAAFYLLAVGLFPQAAGLSMTHCVAVLALAHVAGVLAIFAPAGFGVRELVLAEGLRGILSFDEALLLAAVLRILTLLADGTIVLAAVLFWRRWSRAGAQASRRGRKAAGR